MPNLHQMAPKSTFGLTRLSHNGPSEMQKVVTMQLAIRHSEHKQQWPWSNLLCKNCKTKDIHTMDDLFHKCWTPFAGPGDDNQKKDSYYKSSDIPWTYPDNRRCLQLKVTLMVAKGMNPSEQNDQNVTVPTIRTSYWDTPAGQCLHIPPHPWKSVMMHDLCMWVWKHHAYRLISAETVRGWNRCFLKHISYIHSLSWRWYYRILYYRV